MLQLENEFFTIELSDRKDGYYTCSYKISNDQEYCLQESSGRKIMQRLIRTLGLYKENIQEEVKTAIFDDLKAVGKDLNILEEEVYNFISRYWDESAKQRGNTGNE